MKCFYDMTVRISGSLYVTANKLFSEISDLFCVLNDWMISDDASKRAMGFSMKSKFDKYFGDPDKMNLLIFIAFVFDPREKMDFLQFSLDQIYGPDLGGTIFYSVKSAIQELFNDYVSLYTPASGESASQPTTLSPSDNSMGADAASGPKISMLKAKFKKQKLEFGLGGSKRSELDIYLGEELFEDEGNFNLLRW